jgi:DNA (cytosine-5)-methyltransferase 1
MDNTGESRATVLTPVIGFNWHVGAYSLGITEDGTRALMASSVPAVAGVGVRRLTPLECERLQGFPDDWTAGQADSSRYRQMGNAVAVPVVEWIISRLVEVDGA